MLIAPAELFSSSTPSESSSIVSSEFKMMSPEPVVVTVKCPVPVLTATAVPAVTFPIVIVLAAAPVPIFTAAVSASEAMFKVVPAVKMVAEALKEANPLAAIVVNEPAAGVPLPMAGGAAKTAATINGVIAVSSLVPVVASADVESWPIPETVSLQFTAPANARAANAAGFTAIV